MPTVERKTSPPAPSTEELLAHVESHLAAAIDGAMEAPPRLLEAARHAVLGGGKRLRPLLCIRAALAAGGRVDEALHSATAIELIHAFSLVHDDLPALDNDDLRRGRPTVHRAFGEAMAILCGDFLLGLACATISEGPVEPLRATQELLHATNRMIFGQVFDTLGGTDSSAEADEQLRAIHALKTGALILVSCRLGGIAAAAPPAIVSSLDHYGIALGQMFQAVDDLLDETQTTEHLGKAAGKDRDAGKLTYPRVHGLEGTRTRIEGLRVKALAAISGMGPEADPLRQLAEELATRSR